MIIDAKDAIAGRLAAFAAKKALQGEDVSIVNAESAVISGDPLKTRAKYSGRRHMTQKANPENASKWPKRPDMMFKRIIKGMLPKHSGRGKAAARKIKVYLGVPKGMEGKAEKFAFTAERLANKFITMKELCESI
ncbi:MAG: 50S ribosomal protein L13 [Candidatus Micrarchaeota archaeon]